MVKLIVNKKTVTIDGKEYPPTQHNLEVWKRYLITEDESNLEGLSDVMLDI
jgi:hypothetical protein